jgi:hypothetical protein
MTAAHLIGTALGLTVEDAQTSTAVAGPGPGRGAALAASPSTSHPPASWLKLTRSGGHLAVPLVPWSRVAGVLMPR